MSKRIRLGRKVVGLSAPVYFIADIGANHDGDLARAKRLIYQCAEAGASAAKFQNFSAATIVSDYGFRSLGDQISHQTSWKKSVFEVYSEASLPIEWAQVLKSTCDDAGIDYLTAPYDLSYISKLSEFVCAWKLGSGDITWHEHIENIARDGKPVLIATGAASMEEVRMAVKVANAHNDQIILMQCNTNYTASLENFRYIALNVLKSYAYEFPGVVLGLSDHTPGHTSVLGAVALGACVVEKHFTDDTNRTGPDHKFSMTPNSWRLMVDATRELESALGPDHKIVMENEQETVIIQRRALRARGKIKMGQLITKDHLIALRPCPANALPPYLEHEIIGRFAAHDIDEGDCVRLCDIK